MTCPACGADAPAGARFCPSCGNLLQAPVDERRIATVLFADLVGFTTLSETLDPEQVKNLVDACFDRLAADITAFGGRVDKILGDAIVALFGAPIAHEDDAERAVRAALQMQQTVSTYATAMPSGGAPRIAGMQLRVGVNTGEVLVGTVRAGGEYTAMGDVVNVASRLQGLAEPGQVIVGVGTYTATREVVRYEPLGLVHARGREEPVEAWRAIEALAPPGYRPRRGRRPLVGRTEELGILRYSIATAVARRRAQLLLLVGEAGVGKSRLAEELVTHALTQHEAVVLEGRCVPYGEANPWWPFAEALREACAIDPSDDAELSLAKCRNAVARALAGHGAVVDETNAEVVRIADGLLYLMGDEDRLTDVDPVRAAEDGRRALQAFLEALASTRPVVLSLSELHWADGLVFEVLDHLLDRLRNLPLVFVATARAELEERWRPPVGAHNLVMLHLDPLSPAAAAELLDVLLPTGSSSELKELLLERSGGNPFFLEELVALLGEQGLFTVEFAARELPATLRGLLSARLDTLGGRERSMLEDAAVIGRTGQVETLIAMARARGEYDPPGALDSLVDKDLMVVRGGAWEFRSNLVREVAYETLTKAERARRHYRLATWLSTRLRQLDREDEELEQLAHHYGVAAELRAELGAVEGLPQDVTQVALQAIARAAARAEQRELPRVSLHLVDQALRLLPASEVGERRSLLLSRANSRASTRDLIGAHADVDTVLSEATEVGDQHDEAEALTVLGDIEQKEGHFDESEATLGRAVELWRGLGDRRGEAWALRLRGMSDVHAGRADRAVPDIEEALAAFREVRDRKGEAWALQNLAWAAFSRNQTEEAEARLDEAAKAFSEIGDLGGLGWVIGLLGWVRFQQGDLDEAELLATQITDELRERGDPWATAITQLLLSFVRLWKGQTAEAIPLALEARETFRRLDNPVDEIRSVTPLARAMVARGRVTEGAALLEEVYARASRSGTPSAMQFAAMISGISMIHAGDVERVVQAALLAGDSSDVHVEGIAGAEQLILFGMASLMSGEAEHGLDHLEEAVRASVSGPKANALASVALGRVACGQAEATLEAMVELDEMRNKTYMDFTLGHLAGGLAKLQLGDVEGSEAEFDAAIDRVDGTGDRVMQAVARLARSLALASVESPLAAEADAEARRRLNEIGVQAEGWETIFRSALRPRARA